MGIFKINRSDYRQALGVLRYPGLYAKTAVKEARVIVANYESDRTFDSPQRPFRPRSRRKRVGK